MIYDRTILDVDNAKTIIAKFQALSDWSSITQAEIDTLERGTYTIVSLNRVEQKVEELATIFRSIGYSYTNPEVKTNWTYTDYFNKSQHKRFFENIDYLRGIIAITEDTPQSPFIVNGEYTYGNVTYLLANDAEKILYDISMLLDYITPTDYYIASGAGQAAGVDDVTQRFGKTNATGRVQCDGYFTTADGEHLVGAGEGYFIPLEITWGETGITFNFVPFGSDGLITTDGATLVVPEILGV